MPTTLTSIRTEYISLSQQINVAMVRGYVKDEFYYAIRQNKADNIKCTIQHNAEVKDNQNNILFAKNSSIEWTYGGNINETVGGLLDRKTYTFVPTSPATPTITFVPASPTALTIVTQFNPNDPQYSNLKQLSLTLVFATVPNATTSLTLVLPIGHDWTGTLTVAFPGSGIEDSPPIRLVNQPWGLPSVRGQQHHHRATYRAQPGNLLVKLYNDASEDAAGSAGAFADICTAIAQAQHFIFIADWSFHPDTYMQRPAQGAPDPNDKIGMILINQARQNPHMVIAIHTWYHIDKAVGPFKPDDTKNNDGGVTLDALSGGANQRPNNLLWRMTERSGTLVSHHQKFVVLDAPVDSANPNGDREIKVFWGGLDLTTGRFDWPEHHIHYDDNNDSFHRFEDWYNPECASTVQADSANRRPPSVPRQPWHDIHAQLLGPAAWDFIDEFVGRWQATGTLLSSQGRGFLGRPETEADTAGRVWTKYVAIWDMALSNGNIVAPLNANYPYSQSRPWTAQMCRSMEDGFWAPPAEAMPVIGISVRDKVPLNQKTRSENLCQSLVWKIQHKKWRLTEFEKSIHKAYLQAIARAEDCIYIETQYLIGESKLKTNSTNRIPKAIVERILSINALDQHREFHVYIVTPLYPEGDPLDKPVQPVRYNQWETMKWMKNELTIRLQGGKQWAEYLSFYFLGQRHGAVAADYPNTGTRQQRIAKSNRYMIYVHSKLMIVDDRWIILGSANLNERSMAGNRDSEICVAMWPTPGHQDVQTAADKVKNFRKELWREHLLGSAGYDTLRNSFDAPKAAATVTGIRTAAEHNLSEFIKDTAPTNMGHLMYWDWTTIDTHYLPDSPAGENKLLWAPTELGAPVALDGFR